MWKWFILLWLAQWRTLLSEPVISESIRESRQVNFAECCPCPGSDYDGMEGASTVDRCICRTPDSESAPSLFTPIVKAIDPFMRSGEPKTPKPLLNPEVGLASSVLETLQEVTDQEYQEALVRDATRTAFNDRDENLMAQEMTMNTPRNIVNIILQPKDGNTLDDIMSEASHTQETRCVHPPLSRTNSFDELKVKPKNSVLHRGFPMSTLKNGKTYNDMANSASNIQERKTPLKNNILEDLKLKSDLLKMKLFSNSKNSLKDTFSNANTLNQFDREIQSDNSDNDYPKRVPNNKLGSLLEYLKTSKQKTQPTIVMKKPETEIEDVLFAPSNIQNHNLRNNERYDLFKNSKSPLEHEDLIKTKYDFNSKGRDLNEEFIETQKDGRLQQTTQRIPLSDNNRKTSNSVISDFEKNGCEVLQVLKENNFKETTNSRNIENMGAESNPTILHMSIAEPVDDISAKEINSIENLNNGELSNNMQKETLNKKTIPEIWRNTEPKDNYELIDKKNVKNEPENIIKEEHLCDAEGAGSSDMLKIVKVPQTKDTKNTNDNIKDFSLQKNNLLNAVKLSQTTAEKSHTENDFFKTNPLSNIKDDVIKRTENFKQVNEKELDELKSSLPKGSNINVINLLTNTESNTLKIPKNCNDEINTQDLQEMSDRILNLSLSSEKIPNTVDDNNNNFHDIENLHNAISPSESKNSEIAIYEMQEPTHASSGSLLKKSDKITDEEDTFNSFGNEPDIVDSDGINNISRQNPCENMTPTIVDQYKVNSSNDQEKEMIAEGSSPSVNSIHTNQDYIIQPELNSNVKGLLDNLKSSISNIFNNNDNINSNRNSGHNNANLNRKSLYLEKKYKHSESPFTVNGPRIIDANNNYVQTQARSDSSNWDKNNYQPSRLNSYRAKVASPESLDLRTTPSLLPRKEDTLYRTVQDNSEVMSASSIFRSPIEIPPATSIKKPFNNGQKYSGLNLRKPQKIENLLPSTDTLNSFSENFKSRTEDALRNLKESINDLRKTHMNNQNNMFGEPHTRQNVVWTTLRPSDLDKKLKDFNSDLKDRLTLLSQKIPDIIPFGDKSAVQAKNRIKNYNDKIKSNSQYQVKNNDLLKSNRYAQSVLAKNKKGQSNLSRNPLDVNVKKYDLTQSSKKFEPKIPLRKEIKNKTLKENKITISFTTPRSDILKIGQNQKILNNKLTHAKLRSLINLPKSTSYKTPLQKGLELKSKLNTDEPKSSASNKFTSLFASPGMKSNNPKTAFSSLEESPVNNLFDESPKSSDFSIYNDLGRHEYENQMFKMRNPKVPDDNLDKKFLYNKNNNLKSIAISDANASASNNINKATSRFADKPLKENVSYKCKMICFEDDADSK